MATSEERLRAIARVHQEVEGGVVAHVGDIDVNGKTYEAFRFWPDATGALGRLMVKVQDRAIQLENERKMRKFVGGQGGE